jgi:uncharacterized protein (TIGR02300 family)
VVKPELGTKRLCPNCGTKYYDLDRDPIVCPKCGTPFTAAAVQLRAAKVVPVQEDEVETEEAAPVDFVSLEEADAEASGGEEVPEIEDEELADVDPDIHDDDDTFLETDDEDEDIDGIDIDVAGEEEER